jgi:hypothetical protein
LPRIGPWRERLEALLDENDARTPRERLTLIRIFEDLRALGYGGSYAAVRRYAIACMPTICFIRRWISRRLTSRISARQERHRRKGECSFTPVPVRGHTVNQSSRSALPQVIQFSALSGRNSANASL